MAEAMPFLTFQPSRGPGAAEAVARWTTLFADAEVVSDRRRPMPLDDHGFGPFAWVQDRFGVSWPLNGPA